MRGHHRNGRQVISMFRKRRHCGVKKKTMRPLRRQASRSILLRWIRRSAEITTQPPSSPERAHPHAVFGACRKSIGQVDDLIALRAEQDIQCVGEMRG